MRDLALAVVVCWATGSGLYWRALNLPRDLGVTMTGVFAITFLLMAAVSTMALVLWSLGCALGMCH